MGCSTPYYGKNIKEDYFTRPFYESAKARKLYKLEKKAKKEEEEMLKKQIEQQAEKEREEELNKILYDMNRKDGPLSYFDRLEAEIDKMDFYKIASAEEIKEWEEEEEEEEYDEEDEDLENEPQEKENKNDENNNNNNKNELEKKQKQKIPNEPTADFSPSPKELIIVFIGYEKSGKTSLIKRYTQDKFVKQYFPTQAVEENKTRVYLHKEQTIQLVVVDTPPIPRNGTCQIVQEQICRAHIVIYIFDTTEDDSMFKINLNFSNFDLFEEQIIAVIGTNNDRQTKFSKENKRKVQEFCEQKEIPYNFISNLKGDMKSIAEIIENNIIAEYFKIYDSDDPEMLLRLKRIRENRKMEQEKMKEKEKEKERNLR